MLERLKSFWGTLRQSDRVLQLEVDAYRQLLLLSFFNAVSKGKSRDESLEIATADAASAREVRKHYRYSYIIEIF
jgi:hypothetical protein